MNKALYGISLLVFAIILPACGTTGGNRDVSGSQSLQKLTSSKLQLKLNGNTVEWGDGSVVYYNGTEIRAIGSDGSTSVGSINFKNDQHCISWSTGGERCSVVYEGIDGTLSFFVPGETDSSGGFARVLNGNPKKL